MIYKINGVDAYKIATGNTKFIIYSADGTFALVTADQPIDNFLESYLDSELSNLLSNSLYRQPCKDCYGI
jgi:hypothetical protein